MNVLNRAIQFGLVGAALCASAAAGATTIADWQFYNDPVTAPADNNPAQNAGPVTGMASVIGMTGDADIVGAPDNTFDVWRVRDNIGGNNGWSATAAEYTQGAQFLVSTAGYSNIQLSFEWAATTAGVYNLQVEYTTDGSTWNLAPNGLETATIDTTDTTGFPIYTVSLSGIAAAANDPNFGIRLVSAYNTTNPLAPAGQYSTASTGGGASPTSIGTSGNWRFEDVQIDGTPVPLPAGVWLLVSGLAGIGAVARKRKTA